MEAIRRRLDELGKSQAELARALDIGPPVISKILSGRRVLKAQELPVLAAFLKWPVTTLVGALSSSPARSNRRTTDGPALQWIASRLDELGKTRSGLARALGLPRARVFEIINGTRRVQLSELSPLAAYLNTEEKE